MIVSDFGLEVEIPSYIRIHNEKWIKTQENVSLSQSIKYASVLGNLGRQIERWFKSFDWKLMSNRSENTAQLARNVAKSPKLPDDERVYVHNSKSRSSLTALSPYSFRKCL